LINNKLLALFNVDLIIITIIYLLVFYGENSAVIFAFVLGILIDIFSAGPLGLFALIYLVVFRGIQLGSLLFDLFSSAGQIILVVLAVLLKEILFLSCLYIFSLGTHLSSTEILTFASSALLSGLLAPVVFCLLNLLDHAFTLRLWKALKVWE
jgi:rod shape-determining protein MreD